LYSLSVIHIIIGIGSCSFDDYGRKKSDSRYHLSNVSAFFLKRKITTELCFGLTDKTEK